MRPWVKNRKRNKNSNSNKRTIEYGNWIARGVTHYLIVIQIVYSIWLKLLTLQFKGKHFGRRKSHFKRMQFQNKRLSDKMIIVDQSFCKLDAQSIRKEKVKQCWHRLHTKHVITKTYFHLNFLWEGWHLDVLDQSSDIKSEGCGFDAHCWLHLCNGVLVV